MLEAMQIGARHCLVKDSVSTDLPSVFDRLMRGSCNGNGADGRLVTVLSAGGESIAEFLTFAVIGFVLLYVLRLVIDLLLLPGIKVSNALAVERNVGVAFIESTVVISAALILFFAI